MGRMRFLENSIVSAMAGRAIRKLALALSAFALIVSAGVVSGGDDFDRLEGKLLFDLPSRPDIRTHTALSFGELDQLPPVLRGERDALVIVRTDQGNMAKVLISHGLRRKNPSDDLDSAVPVLIVERFATLDAGDRKSFKARGRDVTIFAGFSFDLDTGQVVPEGFGGDIQLAGKGQEASRLSATGPGRFYTLEKPWPAPAPAPGQPSSGRAVLPADFSGRYYLIANGQWSGKLELAVDAAGAVSGTFRSDRVGTAYPITGKVAPDVPEKIAFSIRFPRGTQQFYDGLLWSEGKNTIAGTLSMLEHPYSFIAIREGSSLLPEEFDFALPGKISGKTARRIVSLDAGSTKVMLDGSATSFSGLADLLAKAIQADPATSVLIRVPGTVPFDRLREVVAAVRPAGITTIQFAPADDRGDPP
jgi:hypothetical protein